MTNAPAWPFTASVNSRTPATTDGTHGLPLEPVPPPNTCVPAGNWPLSKLNETVGLAGGARSTTVNVTSSLVTGSAPLAACTLNFAPESASVVGGVVYELEVAPVMIVLSRNHWNVAAGSLTTTLKVAGLPTNTVWFAGCVVIRKLPGVVSVVI